jgi:hypothetical protein
MKIVDGGIITVPLVIGAMALGGGLLSWLRRRR